MKEVREVGGANAQPPKLAVPSNSLDYHSDILPRKLLARTFHSND